ncbi:cationic amino acid transporter 2, vacuolar isoform X2 [Euphorbia lathyris]|uniref:cationic amino acid transporter 2, vacuolar isoform X2 n=1 Tax=Euphorbia lathyris TaxID=212925 RepID=UPI003313E0F1
MGMLVDMQNDGASKGYWGLRSFTRRKHVDSVLLRREGTQQLAKKLSVIDLIAIGVGATIGAGVYILVGTVAREQTGPALTISFLIAGIAAALSAFCYAELACRCPSAGSAYHYAYICIGEGAAWLVGWALILDYTIGGSAIARGLTPNLALFFGGVDNLPSYLARHTIPWFDIVVDPSAAVLVLIVTVLLCMGIKESSLAQAIVTTANICGMLFIITVGGYLAFKTGWVGYELPNGYFPLGFNGMLAGSAVVFFSFIGFDVVASTAEEVYNNKWCCNCSLCKLNGFTSSTNINERTQVPVKSTLAVGVLASALAFFMDVSQLAGMVSVGALLAFTAVAVSVLILRYVPPDEVPLPPSLQSVDSLSVGPSCNIQEVGSQNLKDSVNSCESSQSLRKRGGISIEDPLLHKAIAQDEQNQQKRRKIAAWSMTVICIGILVLTFAASLEILPSLLRFTLCSVGGALLLCGLIVLACIAQDNTRHSFGHTGGFICPCVPFLPVVCILVNTYLLVNLGGGTWIRVSVWLLVGELVYLFYGQRHSSLRNAVYVPTAYADEIYCTSSGRPM